MSLFITPLIAMTDGQTRLTILAGYMVLLLLLGFFASRWFSGTKSDYLLASHSIGPFLLLMSMFGTTMTAFALVGSTGEAYSKGIGVYAMLASASGIMHSLCFFLIGVKVYQFGRKYGYTTQVQFFRDRLENDFIGVLLFPILVALIIPYLLIGVIAGGKMIEVMTSGALPLNMVSVDGSVPPWIGSLVICLVVLSYVFFGGMRGTAWANAFQTTVFMVLGVVTFYLLANKLGKGDTLFESMTNLSESLSPSKGTRESIRHTKYFTYMLIPLSVGMFPHLFQHWLTAKDAKSFRLPVIMHPVFIMIVWAPCVLIGAWASTQDLPMDLSPNAVLPMLVNSQIGPVMGGFLAAGILAAIMSSLDSQFLCLGTMFTTDVVSHYSGKKKISDQAQVWYARAFIVAIVAVTYTLSLLDGSKSVFTMAIWCFSGFTGLFPIIVAALYWKRLTAAGVLSGTLAMLFSWVYLFRQSGWGADRDFVIELYRNDIPVMPVTAIIFCSTLAMVITSLLTTPPSQKNARQVFSERSRNIMSSRRRKKFSSAESEKHFVDMVSWLAMESQAEVQRMEERRQKQNRRDAEKSGETVLDLIVADHVMGLGGHKLVTFKRRSPDKPMPWHRLRVGSPVVVSAFPIEGSSESGVVSQKRPDSIQVAMNRWPEANVFRIDLTADEVTRQRQHRAIMTAKDAKGRLGKLRDLMMGERDPEFCPPDKVPNVKFLTQLNPTQEEAVRFALSARDLAIIHGPPGTGKTTTVVELICQAVKQGDLVLACAPSNTAVDNLLERLMELKQRVVRVGHPARVSERLHSHTLDGLVEHHENTSIVRDMRREADDLFRRSDKWTRAKRSFDDRRELRQEAKQLLFGAKTLERQAIQSVLDSADVICATTTFNEDLLGDRQFGLAVVDEACQSTEPGCWVPLQRCHKVVLAGDHQQLPPTVLSKQAADEGFAISLMERQIGQWGDTVTRMLGVQYRMHRDIMAFSSEQFYDNELIAHDSVVDHLLHDIESVEESDFTSEIVTFIDSAGANWDEELEPGGLSKRNPHEARLVLQQVELLHEMGLPYASIAVIAPYAAQVRLLRDQFDGEGLEIDTVDGFQGREKEAVVISLVRSNSQNEIGFLSDRRRMNVALTRAKRKLVVIGDSSTLGIDPFYEDFFEYVETCGSYRTVWEFDIV